MKPDLPHLEFIHLDSIVMHEYNDQQRTGPLMERIREVGLWRNPPIVTPLPGEPKRYMLLDGSNRITSLRLMDFPDALVQVIQPDDPGLTLENWNHVLWGIPTVQLIKSIREIPDLNLVPTEECEMVEPDLWGDCGLALIQVPNGNIYTSCTQAQELVTRVNLLNAVVNSYKDCATIDRTMVRNIRELQDVYPQLCGLVIFPQFKIENVLELASQGYLLPTGITRFTISPRALHINYPLFELAADRTLEEKNAGLQEWIKKRLAKKGIRYYEEATFLFDE